MQSGGGIAQLVENGQAVSLGSIVCDMAIQ
jgi:hypothetical protein